MNGNGWPNFSSFGPSTGYERGGGERARGGRKSRRRMSRSSGGLEEEKRVVEEGVKKEIEDGGLGKHEKYRRSWE